MTQHLPVGNESRHHGRIHAKRDRLPTLEPGGAVPLVLDHHAVHRHKLLHEVGKLHPKQPIVLVDGVVKLSSQLVGPATIVVAPGTGPLHPTRAPGVAQLQQLCPVLRAFDLKV